MKNLRMFLFALIAFGAFSCYADDDWSGFQDGQFETIGRDGEHEYPDHTEDGDDDDDDKEDDDNATTNG